MCCRIALPFVPRSITLLTGSDGRSAERTSAPPSFAISSPRFTARWQVRVDLLLHPEGCKATKQTISTIMAHLQDRPSAGPLVSARTVRLHPSGESAGRATVPEEVGASSVAQLEENVGALEGLTLTAEELADIDNHAVEGGVNAWAASSEA
jgi:hypothetical protein